jgi:hypothetical protein
MDELKVELLGPEVKTPKGRAPFVVFHVTLVLGGKTLALIRGWRCIGGFIAPPQIEAKGGKWRATTQLSRAVLELVYEAVDETTWWEVCKDLPPLKDFETAVEEAELSPRALQSMPPAKKKPKVRYYKGEHTYDR